MRNYYPKHVQHNNPNKCKLYSLYSVAPLSFFSHRLSWQVTAYSNTSTRLTMTRWLQCWALTSHFTRTFYQVSTHTHTPTDKNLNISLCTGHQTHTVCIWTHTALICHICVCVRVRDGTILLPQDEVCISQAERRADVRWLQGNLSFTVNILLRSTALPTQQPMYTVNDFRAVFAEWMCYTPENIISTINFVERLKEAHTFSFKFKTWQRQASNNTLRI